MNVVSLFAGIGGFELGLERAGMNVVAQCEISPVCRHLLAVHWPHVRQFGDICEMRGADIPERVHVICGGFPCQDISFAGKGAGLAGERSGLWREYARLVRELRPAFVIVENVAALLGRGLGDVLGDLAALGYDAWWDCIPASAVGAPHRRDRLWIVAYSRGQQHEGYGEALRREITAGLSRAAAEQGICSGHGGEVYAFDPDADGIRPYRPRVHVNGDTELRDEQVGLAEPLGGHVANASGERRGEARRVRHSQSEERPARCGETINALADASRELRHWGGPSAEQDGRGQSANGRHVGDADGWIHAPEGGWSENPVPGHYDSISTPAWKAVEHRWG